MPVSDFCKGFSFSSRIDIPWEVMATPSLTWRSVWSARKVVDDGLCWRVGSGYQIRPWVDRWLPREHVQHILMIPLSASPRPDLLARRFDNTGVYSVKSAYESLYEFDAANAQMLDGNRRQIVRWSPPPSSHIKFNFDAGFCKTQKTSYSGIIARNNQGRLILAAAILTQNVASPVAAEAMACLHATQIAFSWGWCQVILEVDSTTVFQTLNSSEVDRSPIARITRHLVGGI